MGAFIAAADDGEDGRPPQRGADRSIRGSTRGAAAPGDRPKSVLLVEDDLLSRTALRTALFRRGFVVVEAATARSGLTAATRERVDSIVLDLQLPDVSGFEVLRRLKRDPKTRDIPVVVLTILSAHRDRDEAIRGGCTAFLVKPPNLNELAELLDSFGHRPPALTVVQAPEGDDA